MRTSARSNPARRDTNLTLSLWLERYPDAKIICASCGIMPKDVTLKRSVRAVGYLGALNTIIIEYYE